MDLMACQPMRVIYFETLYNMIKHQTWCSMQIIIQVYCKLYRGQHVLPGCNVTASEGIALAFPLLHSEVI